MKRTSHTERRLPFRRDVLIEMNKLIAKACWEHKCYPIAMMDGTNRHHRCVRARRQFMKELRDAILVKTTHHTRRMKNGDEIRVVVYEYRLTSERLFHDPSWKRMPAVQAERLFGLARGCAVEEDHLEDEEHQDETQSAQA